ncbi:MAG: nucleotide-binding protein [Endomicrobiaceae bacterium]|nr:nucleotide-binding protein [Endomicrobiaceae bacterium]
MSTFKTNKEKINALKEQIIFQDVKEKINWSDLLKKTEIKLYKKNEIIIKEGDLTSDIFLILKGSVNILVKNQCVATRPANEHIGEIVALFSAMKRTATCIVAETSYLAKIRSTNFIQLLNKNPKIYKQIAYTLAKRLEQRNNLIERNIRKKPTIFIASSTEGKTIAKKIAKQFKKFCTVQEWYHPKSFVASKSGIESLECVSANCDFGLIVLTPDDERKMRGKTSIIPRDNLIFELGLFIGKLTRTRTFFLTSTKNLELPSDLKGVNYLTLDNYKNLIGIIKEKGCI